ncbi:MAG: RNA polymerase sigma factor [Nitrososphaerales archaeon]
MSEQDIVTLARKGDQAAFTILVQTYQTPIYNLCYRMLGEADQAQDATQETFLRAYTQFHRYDPERPFKTWLFSIASHFCIDRLRRRRVTWLDIDDEPLSGHPALREKRVGPEDAALQGERASDVQALLETLPPKDRAAVVMLYWYDLSYQEIAEATGTTVSAVKSRLHRARAAMADTLQAKDARDRAPQRRARPAPLAGTGALAAAWA